jgi:hypothetical protein
MSPEAGILLLAISFDSSDSNEPRRRCLNQSAGGGASRTFVPWSGLPCSATHETQRKTDGPRLRFGPAGLNIGPERGPDVIRVKLSVDQVPLH